MSTLIQLASSPKNTHALVGSTGGRTAHFLEGLEVNRRDPWPGGDNYHMLQPTNM